MPPDPRSDLECAVTSPVLLSDGYAHVAAGQLRAGTGSLIATWVIVNPIDQQNDKKYCSARC